MRKLILSTILVFILSSVVFTVNGQENKDSLVRIQIVKDSANAVTLIDSIKTLKNELEAAQNLIKTTKNIDKQRIEIENSKKILQKLTDKNTELQLLNKKLFQENTKLKLSVDEEVKKNMVIKNANVNDSIKNDSIRKKTDTLSNNVLKQLGILDSVRALLERVKDTMVVISEVSLAKMNIPIYKDTNSKQKQNRNKREALNSDDTCRIREVKIRIKEGTILYINIYTNKGVFRNKKSPIGLTQINDERMYDKLFKDGYESVEFIYLNDVIVYTPRRNYNNIPYADIEFSLNKKDSIHFVNENTNINFYVDVAAFTDLKGISGDANGLAQIYMSGKFITSTKNIANTALIPFNFITVEGFIAKFDNSFKGTYIDTLTAKVDRTKMFQTSYYRVGAKVNLLHWVTSPYPKRLIEDMQLNFGYNFNGANTLRLINKATAGTPVFDTIFTPIIQNQWYLEPVVRFTRNSNFGFSISVPIIWQSVKASAGVSNKETIVYANPTISLSYYSPRSPSNRIFFRYSNFIDLKNPENAFTQAQLGYSASLTDVFKINR